MARTPPRRPRETASKDSQRPVKWLMPSSVPNQSSLSPTKILSTLLETRLSASRVNLVHGELTLATWAHAKRGWSTRAQRIIQSRMWRRGRIVKKETNLCNLRVNITGASYREFSGSTFSETDDRQPARKTSRRTFRRMRVSSHRGKLNVEREWEDVNGFIRTPNLTDRP